MHAQTAFVLFDYFYNKVNFKLETWFPIEAWIYAFMMCVGVGVCVGVTGNPLSLGIKERSRK